MYALIAFSGIYVVYVVYNEFKFYKENLGGQNLVKMMMTKGKSWITYDKIEEVQKPLLFFKKSSVCYLPMIKLSI